jgi:hypothetical protein
MTHMLTPLSQQIVHRIRYKPGIPRSYLAFRDKAPNSERHPSRLADARRIEKAMEFVTTSRQAIGRYRVLSLHCRASDRCLVLFHVAGALPDATLK